MKKILSIILSLIMLLTLVTLSACGGEENEIYIPNHTDPQSQISAPPNSGKPTAPVYEDVVALLNNYTDEAFSTEQATNESYKAAYEKFTYDYFRTVGAFDKKGNVCLSPFSAYMAFSLCFMGSDGVTAKEFEKIFGLNKEDAAKYCQALYGEILQANYGDKNTKVNLANSVWIDNAYAQYVKENYLKNATDHFNAAVYRGDFSDPATIEAINGWCADNTDGLIKKIVEEFDKDQFMALLNALLIEAAWKYPYSDYQVVKDDFKNADGSKTQVDYLCDEKGAYYSADDAKAFKVGLCDGFSFVGILPNENISVDDYIANLTPNKINDLMGNLKNGNISVNTRIPKFNIDYEVDLVDIMWNMGMTSAFDWYSANFKPMAEIPDYNVYISSAIQKTHFELDEKGIKAAAVTYIGIVKYASAPKEIINIYLDRPFVYMLIDDATGLPLFIGTIKKI